MKSDSDSQEEKHHWKKAETVKKPATIFSRSVTKIVFICSDCGDTKVIEI